MVNGSTRLDGAFSALGDPTRRAILARLALGETTVSELARPFPVSLPAISKHLRVLQEAGLVRSRKEGRSHWCTLEAGPMREASAWLEEYRDFWEKRLDALADYLSREARAGKRRPAPKKERTPAFRRRRRHRRTP